MCFLNYLRTVAPTRPTSRCRQVGFLAPTATRRIRFGTDSAVAGRSSVNASLRSKGGWLASVIRNSSISSGALSRP